MYQEQSGVEEEFYLFFDQFIKKIKSRLKHQENL